MITPYKKPEDKDAKAGNFWQNLTAKLGLKAPIVHSASAEEMKVQRLSDGIQTHATRVRENVRVASSDAAVTRVSDQDKLSSSLVERYAGIFHRAVAELGQAERVKAADRLSRIEEDMASFRDKCTSLGGDSLMIDLCGEIGVKADSISGACMQLREKVDALSTPQAEAIENAFLLLSDAKSYLEKLQAPAAAPMPMDGMEVDLGAPIGDEIEGDIPDMPPAPKAEHDEKDDTESGLTAGGRAWTRKAADVAYDDLRCVHTKLLLVDSVLNSLVSEMNVGSMLGGPEMETPGMPPEGMPPMEEMSGEQAELEGPAPVAEAALRGRLNKFAASGDPGDSEPGNTIYKDLGKCRDCVWFESDWTHETYRDKCKHCIHACLGGATENFWPRAQQMIMWLPQWAAPEAKKKAFQGTLGLSQTASTVSAAAAHIASEILKNCAHSAVELGSELVAYFTDPVVAHSMPLIAGEVVAEIENQTGIEIAISAKKARAWGRGRYAGVRVPKDHEVQPLKPGENPPGKTTCGTCNLSWDDDKVTSMTPTPSARCPFEYFHEYDEEGPDSELEDENQRQKASDYALNGPMVPAKNPLGIGGTAAAADRKYNQCDKPTGEFPNEGKCGRPAKAPGSRCELHPIKKLWPGDDEPAASGLSDTCPGCDSDQPFEPGCHGFGCKEESKYVGQKKAAASGEVMIACDMALVQLAKGEKRKIKELREQLHGEKDSAKIKSINDAIDSLYARIDSDKERRDKRKKDREEKRKANEAAAAPAEPAVATASLHGTLCLGEKANVAGRSL